MQTNWPQWLQLQLFLLLLLLLLLPTESAGSSIEEGGGDNSSSSVADEGIKIADWKWHELSTNAIIVMFLLVASLLKTVYHHIHALVTYVPESNVLILLGVAIGVIVFFTVPTEQRSDSLWNMEPHLFFLILLPPIMLEAAYSLYDRAFVDNIGSILFFAVGGTVLNFLMVGFGLFGLSAAGAMGRGGISDSLPLNVCLLFGSFIVAVDPVAVLAIFHDIGVDHSLYYLVFGESLLNDAVTVVLYNTMNAFAKMPHIQAVDILLGVVSFFSISIGGLVVGVVFGIFSSMLTRFTYSARVVEPLVLLTLAYGAYVFGDMLGWSGLVSIIACGIVQAAYAFHNVSTKSLTTLKYFTKMASNAAEAIVFLYLGVELVKKSHIWDTGFALWALLLCFAARFLVTFSSSAALNKAGRKTPIKVTEQFIIAFGGLRGAVAFALAKLITEDSLTRSGVDKSVREMFLTSTLFMVMFTCLGNGMLIKPIVKCLHIRLQKQQLTCVFHEVINHTMDHLDAGIEEIAGCKGDNYFRETFDRWDLRFVRPLLQRDPSTHDERIVEMHHKVGLKMHLISTERDSKKSSQMLSSLAPTLTRQYQSNASVPSLLEQETAHSSASSLSELPPTESQPQPRIGQRRRSVSENPNEVDADEVRKIMQAANVKNQQAHSNFSRALSSDHDLSHHLRNRRSRMARALRMLRHTGTLLHRRGHHHACSLTADAAAAASHSSVSVDKINEQWDIGDCCQEVTEPKDRRIHFALDIHDEEGGEGELEEAINGNVNSAFSACSEQSIDTRL